jgi:hypothetical protein
MRAAEVVCHSPVEVMQCLLLHHLAARAQPVMLRPGGSELPALLRIAGGALAAMVPVGVLLDGQVPDEPSVGAMSLQHLLLSRRREDTEAGHTNTLASTTDFSGEVKRRCLPDLKVGGATPRS